VVGAGWCEPRLQCPWNFLRRSLDDVAAVTSHCACLQEEEVGDARWKRGGACMQKQKRPSSGLDVKCSLLAWNSEGEGGPGPRPRRSIDVDENGGVPPAYVP
jgi:hypothetical protein